MRKFRSPMGSPPLSSVGLFICPRHFSHRKKQQFWLTLLGAVFLGQSPLSRESERKRRPERERSALTVADWSLYGCQRVFFYWSFLSSISQTSLSHPVESLSVTDITVRKIQKYVLLKEGSMGNNYSSRDEIRKKMEEMYMIQCTLK